MNRHSSTPLVACLVLLALGILMVPSYSEAQYINFYYANFGKNKVQYRRFQMEGVPLASLRRLLLHRAGRVAAEESSPMQRAPTTSFRKNSTIRCRSPRL